MDKNFENAQELEEMRMSLNALKNKLDKQEIVNERLLRQSMKSKMSWIHRYTNVQLFFVPLVALCFLPLVLSMNLSWWLYGFTIIMVAVSAGFDWFINHMSGLDFMKGNLMETASRLAKMKRLRIRHEIVGMTVLVFWIIWLVYEIYKSGMEAPAESGMQEMAWGYIIGVGVGLVIGLIIGFSIFFKMQRTNDEIIQQIEEITGENML